MKRKSIINRAFASLAICGLVATSCTTVTPQGVNTDYKLMTVTLSNRSLSNEYSAAISGKQSVEIRPQVGGTLTEVRIVEGAPVKKGQTLFIIDQAPYKAALQTALANVESAKASVATAQLTAESKQELFSQNVISSFDLQTAKNALLVAKATLAQAEAQETIARTNLAYTVVTSPVNGVASMTSYRVGALVNSAIATPLVTVSDDSDVYAYFSMTENQILALSRQNGILTEAIKAMPKVSLRLSDGTMYDQQGTIDAISGIVNTATGAVSIRAIFPNAGKILRSGGSGSIVFPYEKTDCIVIPQAATYEIQDKVYVYKVIDGKASSAIVSIFGINDGREYIVESGLQVGETIIAEGAGLVQEGATITPLAQNAEQPTKEN